ncbi:MAG: hypothetical protein A3C47_05680 [Omnitrophica bacterium RIFCSPHIGHO2_02_FULL_51_18]|nr:MAG: hypothetical protein A3C47_05680 [Omnitrophica bacterium RIFCSPHIGHO2_02_FULL_51_18]
MAKIHFDVEALWASERIDSYLAKLLKHEHSREEIKRSIKKGQITVNGKHVEPRHLLKPGDRIETEISVSKTTRLAPEEMPLKVIYEDNELLIVDKPAGMVVHPGAGHPGGTLVNALLGRGSTLSSVGGQERPGIVHRLDKETSGLLVIAKTNRAHRLLQSQFADRSFSKTYLAVVRGRIEFEEGHVSEPIGRHPKIRQKMAVSRLESAKAAETRYRVLKRFKTATLLEIKLLTGRTHQIRVHMAHLGHPVVGDGLYGTKGDFKRHALHAARIQFIHPQSGKLMKFEAETPEDFKLILKNAVAQ